LKFDSYLILEEDLPFGTKRLLEVNRRVVLPINVTLRFLVTSGDVLHSWAIPEMGIKVDAVPGRLNQFLTLIRKPGIFYGQCSELCGVAHGFMPIVIHAVSYEEFHN
jgi:heme/copper-type cytochrome/quinol oxidase subunit 2